MLVFVPIVEGHGEQQAVPALLYRLAHQQVPLRVNPPIRIKSGSFLRDEEYFRRYVELAAAKAAETNGHVLILLDCEDGCSAELGPRLLQRACEVHGQVSFLVCLAYREYETWFVTAAPSLGGHFGLPNNLQAPAEPERIRDAKGWLSQHMPRRYDPIVHQLGFSRVFDITQARCNASFRRLHDWIQNLTQP
jgi:hypothetical protein